MSRVIRVEIEYQGPHEPGKEIPIVECSCGEEVYCGGNWVNKCRNCGTEYNGKGQELNPHNLSGWENGEKFK